MQTIPQSHHKIKSYCQSWVLLLLACLVLGWLSGCAAVKAGLTTDMPNALKWCGDRINAPSERGGSYEAR